MATKKKEQGRLVVHLRSVGLPWYGEKDEALQARLDDALASLRATIEYAIEIHDDRHDLPQDDQDGFDIAWNLEVEDYEVDPK